MLVVPAMCNVLPFLFHVLCEPLKLDPGLNAYRNETEIFSCKNVFHWNLSVDEGTYRVLNRISLFASNTYLFPPPSSFKDLQYTRGAKEKCFAQSNNGVIRMSRETSLPGVIERSPIRPIANLRRGQWVDRPLFEDFRPTN